MKNNLLEIIMFLKNLLNFFIISLILFTTACNKSFLPETFSRELQTESFFEAAQRLKWDLNLCENKNFIYYKNDSGIWKYDKTSHKEEQILAEKSVDYIYLEGNLLYYASHKKNKNEFIEERYIYELSIEGKKQLVCKTSDFAKYDGLPEIGSVFFKFNEMFYIYYFNGGLLKFNSVSKKIEIFNNDIGFDCLLGNKFYNTGFRKNSYQETNFINETNLLTGEQKHIYITKKTMSSHLDIIAFDDELFFTNEYNELCKFLNNGKMEKIFVSNSIEGITFPNQCINEFLYYCIENGNNNSLYRYDPKTGNNIFKCELPSYFNYGYIIFHDVLIYIGSNNEYHYILIED